VTPKFKANLVARYEFPLGKLNAYMQGAGVYNGDSYSDLTRADRAALGIQDAYTIADFTFGVSTESFTVELFLKNAFDERARTTTFVGCATSTCGTLPYFVPNLPRQIGLSLSQKF